MTDPAPAWSGTSSPPLRDGGLRRLAHVGLLLLVVTIAAFLAFHRLGAAPLRGDEAIHAEVAREAAAGSWLPPSYDGHLYLSKPPLKILAVAALFERFGVDELTARAIDAFCGVAVVVLVFVVAARALGLAEATLASALLATMPLYLFEHGVRDGVQDSALVLLLSATIVTYVAGARRGSRRSAVIGGVLLGAAGWVKGPAAALALPVLLAWELAVGRRLARARTWQRDLALAIGIGGLVFFPYLAAALAWSGGGFLRVMEVEVVQRVTRAIDPNHVQGPTFYLRQLGRELGPWLFALVPAGVALALRRERLGRRERACLEVGWIWAGVWLLVVSLSRSKLPWYLYPAYPAVACLVAAGVGGTLREVAERARRDARWWPLWMAAVLVMTVGIALRVATAHARAHEAEPPVPAAIYAATLERLPDVDLVVHREAELSPADQFYVGSLGPRVWRVPHRLREPVPDGCRFLVRENPALPAALRPARGARAWPLAGRSGRAAWLLDLDACLDRTRQDVS